MQRWLHALLIATVLMCALHIGEPARAHDAGQHGLYVDADASHEQDQDQDHSGPTKAAHAGHHHCPVAPDQRIADGQHKALPGDELRFVRPVAALKSLSQAPPVEPPVA